MKCFRIWFPLLACLLSSSVSAYCQFCFALPDTRTWEQVASNFIANEGRDVADGGSYGRRLKKLDPKRAAAFLIPFLARNQSYGLRMKAIEALGWSSFHEAIPALSAIALDATENEEMRAQALNPGLRYMKSVEAVKTASVLATDKSDRIRNNAYWVLSDHGTDDAIKVLATRLGANDSPLVDQLILALTLSKHPRAGKIVFDLVNFSALPPDEPHLFAYSIAMERYRIPEALQNMLFLARQRDRPGSCGYALRYFSSFPREDVVPALIAYIEPPPPLSDLSATVTEFMKSPKISDESKSKLSGLIASGKVRKREPIIR